MTAQYLEYVRQELIVATADLSGATKGQLVAFAENAQFEATARSRGRKKIVDPVTGRLVNPSNPPIPGHQSRAKGSAIALVSPVEYRTASWRRAVMAMEEHQRAWLLWNYSEDNRWEWQVVITRWGWEQFNQQLVGRRVAKKTVDRLKALIWLAAQDVKEALAGREQYQYQELAALVGVNKTNWAQNYATHWQVMVGVFEGLDKAALMAATRSRSQQKATNLSQCIA